MTEQVSGDQAVRTFEQISRSGVLSVSECNWSL